MCYQRKSMPVVYRCCINERGKEVGVGRQLLPASEWENERETDRKETQERSNQ